MFRLSSGGEVTVDASVTQPSMPRNMTDARHKLQKDFAEYRFIRGSSWRQSSEVKFVLSTATAGHEARQRFNLPVVPASPFCVPREGVLRCKSVCRSSKSSEEAGLSSHRASSWAAIFSPNFSGSSS